MSPHPLSWGNDFACNFGVGLLCGKDHKGERGYESTRLLILIESIVCVRGREGVPLRDLW